VVNSGGLIQVLRNVTDTLAKSANKGGKLVEGVSGNPLYTTGAYDSTPTAGGSYAGQGSPKGTITIGDDLTPAQAASDLKQGDALFKRGLQGNPIYTTGQSGNLVNTGRTFQPIGDYSAGKGPRMASWPLLASREPATGVPVANHPGRGSPVIEVRYRR
jgi:hypothetical protein